MNAQADAVTGWSAVTLEEGFGPAQLSIALSEHFPVSLIATSKDKLRTIEDSLRVSQLTEDQSLRNFDFLPITRKGKIQRLLRFGELKKTRAIRDPEVLRRTAWFQAEPLSESNLMSVGDPLLSFILDADSCPCRLLLHNGQITGIVTLSDLQRLPVRPVLFTLVTHVELLMASLLRQANDFEQLVASSLSSKAQRRLNTKWERLRRSGLAIDRVSATEFSEKASILSKMQLQKIIAKECQIDLKEIESLRHLVAHAGDYALSRKTASETARRARLAQKWITILSMLAGAPTIQDVPL